MGSSQSMAWPLAGAGAGSGAKSSPVRFEDYYGSWMAHPSMQARLAGLERPAEAAATTSDGLSARDGQMTGLTADQGQAQSVALAEQNLSQEQRQALEATLNQPVYGPAHKYVGAMDRQYGQYDPATAEPQKPTVRQRASGGQDAGLRQMIEAQRQALEAKSAQLNRMKSQAEHEAAAKRRVLRRLRDGAGLVRTSAQGAVGQATVARRGLLGGA